MSQSENFSGTGRTICSDAKSSKSDNEALPEGTAAAAMSADGSRVNEFWVQGSQYTDVSATDYSKQLNGNVLADERVIPSNPQAQHHYQKIYAFSNAMQINGNVSHPDVLKSFLGGLGGA